MRSKITKEQQLAECAGGVGWISSPPPPPARPKILINGFYLLLLFIYLFYAGQDHILGLNLG